MDKNLLVSKVVDVINEKVLLEKIDKMVTNQEDIIEIIDFDYSDDVSMDIFDKINDTVDTFKEFKRELDNIILYELNFDLVIERRDLVKDELIDKYLKELNIYEEYIQQCKDILNDDNNDILRSIYDTIYIDFNIDQLIRNSGDLNLNFISNDEVHISENNLDGFIINNSSNIIEKLFRSQGYKLGDIKNDKKVNESSFLLSVKKEIENTSYDYGNELAILISADIEDYYRIKNDKNIRIDKSEIGFFNKYNGSGSCLEIELEKPFTINIEDFDIQVEGSENNCGYSIDETYGLCSSVWEKAKYEIL